MIKLYIPVVDTEKNTFDGKLDISSTEYANMVVDSINEQEKNVDKFFNSQNKTTTIDSEVKQMNQNEKTDESNFDFTLKECEAYITDTSLKPIDENYFMNHIEDGKMFIAIVDINPDTIDIDAESELRFLLGDSDKILKDRNLTDEVKMKSLPTFSLYADILGKLSKLKDCKIIEMYKIHNHPYKFGLLVNKINYEK